MKKYIMKILKKIILSIFIFTVFIISITYAADIIIIDANRTPLENAQIIVNSEGGQVTVKKLTDPKGAAEIDLPGNGQTIKMTISKSGYHSRVILLKDVKFPITNLVVELSKADPPIISELFLPSFIFPHSVGEIINYDEDVVSCPDNTDLVQESFDNIKALYPMSFAEFLKNPSDNPFKVLSNNIQYIKLKVEKEGEIWVFPIHPPKDTSRIVAEGSGIFNLFFYRKDSIKEEYPVERGSIEIGSNNEKRKIIEMILQKSNFDKSSALHFLYKKQIEGKCKNFKTVNSTVEAIVIQKNIEGSSFSILPMPLPENKRKYRNVLSDDPETWRISLTE